MVSLLVAAAACAAALGLGILIGRGSAREARRRCDALERELAETRQQHASYRTQVGEHFTRTSELVHDLTLRYRAVYEHLADGARTLCPDQPMVLARGAETAALLPEQTAGGDGTADELSGGAEPELPFEAAPERDAPPAVGAAIPEPAR